MKIKKFLMNPWTISIGSGLTILLITIVIDLITAETVFSTITLVWHGILAFLNMELKVCWIITGIAALVFLLYLRLMYSKKIVQKDQELLEYTKDNILGFLWKWSWEKNVNGKYDIENLHPICPECETPLPHELYFGQTRCLRCKMIFDEKIPDYNDVRMLILDNARRRFFPNE